MTARPTTARFHATPGLVSLLSSLLWLSLGCSPEPTTVATEDANALDAIGVDDASGDAGSVDASPRDTSGVDSAAADSNIPIAGPVSLKQHVLPIMAEQCGFCHSPSGQPEAIVNKVYYKTRADILGLIGGPIVAGDSASSSLIKIMKQQFGVGKSITLMPPPSSKRAKMSDADIDLVAQWIDAGAQDN